MSLGLTLIGSWIGYGPFLCSLLVTLLIGYYWIWSRSRFVRLINALPGPDVLPFLGNFMDLNVDHDEYLKIVHFDWVNKYGAIYRLWLGRPAVLISSPEFMEPILTSQKLISKAVEYRYLSSWLGNCMFLTTGNRWRNRRRLLTTAFHFQILNSFVDIFNEKSADCAREFTKAIEVHGEREIDIFPIMTQCALDIICETSMGRQTRSEAEKTIYVKNLHRIGQIVMEHGIRPWLALDWIYKLSSLGRENQRCVKALHTFTNQVIRDRREILKRKENCHSHMPKGSLNNNNLTFQGNQGDLPKERLAFLDLLIKASGTNVEFSDDDIREEVDTVMFAGHDTTASAMSFFLHCIARYPEHQQLVFQEVDAVFGDSDRDSSVQDAAELKYLECCIKETLRLYPSVPAIMRCLTEDTEIGGYKLPAGTSVALMIHGMHHSPLVYPDPETFDPKRFLPGNSIGRHSYAFLPFSAGPRNCIGQKYGMLEIKVVLANLMRRFQFSVSDPSAPLIVPSSEVVLKRKHGILLILSKRSVGEGTIN